MLDALVCDLRDVTNLLKRAWKGVTATRCVDARGGDRFDGTTPKEIPAGRTPIERTGLITDALWEVKRARDAARLGETGCEILFGLRAPATTVVFAPETVQLAAFLPRERVPVAVGLATDFGRQASIVADRGERRTGSFRIRLVVIEFPPLRAVVDRL